MKLKNYSSGMLVRLAFSVMIQSDAEILLIDEVLAVGDAAFQQKCADVFHEIRDSDRTVVLVTHDMGAVEHYCHRAMLLHDGRGRVRSATPTRSARQLPAAQLRAGADPGGAARATGAGRRTSRLVDAWLRGRRRRASHERRDGRRAASAGRLRSRPATSTGRASASSSPTPTASRSPGSARISTTTGRRSARARAEGDASAARSRTRWHPAATYVKAWVYRDHNFGDVVLHAPHVLDFVVFGAADAWRRRPRLRDQRRRRGGAMSASRSTPQLRAGSRPLGASAAAAGASSTCSG